MKFHSDFVSAVCTLVLVSTALSDPNNVTEANWAFWSRPEIAQAQLSMEYNTLTPFQADLPRRLAFGLREYGRTFAPTTQDLQLIVLVTEYDQKEWREYRTRKGCL